MILYVKKFVLLKISVFLIPVVLFLMPGCAYIQKSIDIRGIKSDEKNFTSDYNPGTPEELQHFLDNLSIKDATKPLHLDKVTIQPMDRWKLKSQPGRTLIMEKASFPSEIKHPDGNDTAVFYIFRQGELKNRKVILWVPGMGVSDMAFRFIKNFFNESLKRDYDIVFFVPPYHLERTEKGKKTGEGFFTSNTIGNFKVILSSIQELRTMYSWLKKEGVSEIGGWGGSMGGSMLLLLSGIETLDHICVMIPVIDWKAGILNNSNLAEYKKLLVKSGFSEELLDKAYEILSPAYNTLKIDPLRTMVLYAEYDQITPVSITETFIKKYSIQNTKKYKRSHGTILLSSDLYKDYGKFLDSISVKN